MNLFLKNDSTNEDKLRILGKYFINKNKERGDIIYNQYVFELKEFFEDIDNNNKEYINLILCLNKDINDIGDLFCDCKSLISINRIYDINYKFDSIYDDFKDDISYINDDTTNLNLSHNIYLNLKEKTNHNSYNFNNIE